MARVVSKPPKGDVLSIEDWKVAHKVALFRDGLTPDNLPRNLIGRRQLRAAFPLQTKRLVTRLLGEIGEHPLDGDAEWGRLSTAISSLADYMVDNHTSLVGMRVATHGAGDLTRTFTIGGTMDLPEDLSLRMSFRLQRPNGRVETVQVRAENVQADRLLEMAPIADNQQPAH